MHTSYEQRLEFLHQFLDGAEAFHAKLANARLIKGDGWALSSGDSRFGLLNPVIIQTGRKEAVDEVIAAIASNQSSSNIRLVGPGIVHISALAEHGYKNNGGMPFMLWSADNTLDDFHIREGLTVRRLVPSDLETINAIYADVFKLGPEIVADFGRMLFASDNDHTYGLFKDGEMVSVVTAIIYKDTIGIWSMGTPTVHQKNGYGIQLLKFVMKTHKDMGAKNFFLDASSAGKHLYDKCGWIVLDYLPYLTKGDSN